VGPTYLLDTNILVHFVRDDPTWQALRAYSLFARQPSPTICVVAVGELMALAQRLKWGSKRRSQMDFALSHLARDDTAHPAIYQAYADLDEYSEHVGRPMGKNDLWIAATAVAKGYRLLTTDRDFDHLAPAIIDLEHVAPVP
jgi:tRNA(fMet)-specific endonuclease VapC